MSSNVNPVSEVIDDDDAPVMIRPIESRIEPQRWPRDESGNKLHWRTLFKVHPAADVFPMLPDDELAKLVDDVTANDLQQTPVFWESPNDRILYLLDGRNRLEASLRADIKLHWICGSTGWSLLEPSVQYVDGAIDPVAFIISANVHRRHLSKQEQADLIVAARTANSQIANFANWKKGGSGGSTKNPEREAIMQDCAKQGISERTAATAIAKAKTAKTATGSKTGKARKMPSKPSRKTASRKADTALPLNRLTDRLDKLVLDCCDALGVFIVDHLDLEDAGKESLIQFLQLNANRLLNLAQTIDGR